MNVIFKDDSIGGSHLHHEGGPPNGSDGGRSWYERLASRGFMGTELTGVMTLLVHRLLVHRTDSRHLGSNHACLASGDSKRQLSRGDASVQLGAIDWPTRLGR